MRKYIFAIIETSVSTTHTLKQFLYSKRNASLLRVVKIIFNTHVAIKMFNLISNVSVKCGDEWLPPVQCSISVFCLQSIIWIKSDLAITKLTCSNKGMCFSRGNCSFWRWCNSCHCVFGKSFPTFVNRLHENQIKSKRLRILVSS